MRLIDADALIADIKECIEAKYDNYECEQARGLKVALSCVDNAPTIEPERKRGKWIRKSPTAWSWTCSCCKKDDAYAYSAGESFEPDVLQDLFCPNCGADMRGENDDIPIEYFESGGK